MIVGGYTMDIYCDHPEHKHPIQTGEQFFGRNFSDCVRQAKKEGWLFRLRKSPQEAICQRWRKIKVEAVKDGN